MQDFAELAKVLGPTAGSVLLCVVAALLVLKKCRDKVRFNWVPKEY